MKRRSFIGNAATVATGIFFKKYFSFASIVRPEDKFLFSTFQHPDNIYYPFVRWWWNGDKIEKNELARELRLLKATGISGVEITPIKFPAKTDDLGKRPVEWLSNEWIELLQFACNEATSLGMTCDLLVGSGWPFGGAWLADEERSQIMVIVTKVLHGPGDYDTQLSDLLEDAEPTITSPFAGRQAEVIAVHLLPARLSHIDDVMDLSGQIKNGFIHCKVPSEKHVLYALVKIKGFMQIIQGAPGASGPVLNHYNAGAVKKYLSHITSRIGETWAPLSSNIHSVFIDSLELEGANWCEDMREEFQRRRGYDLMPMLPLVLRKITAMGNSMAYDYGVECDGAVSDTIERARYDFELTKSELLKERFVDSIIEWCKENKLRFRIQAYGRGYHPLDGSLDTDVPECETWIRPGLGMGMSETDYRIGRGYTMINKYVSSAAHLKGKNQISCEEMTNIHMVFNETLELMKVAGDQSIISGVTHSVLHGFNYSPPDALFPGWVIYGSFFNERNPWWPYLHYLIEYKARLFALLQNATMFADIAVLSPVPDLWAKHGAQNEPFPAVMYPSWQTLIWESIHQNGNACDYVSEQIIHDASIAYGHLVYGPRSYHTLFLPQVEIMSVETAGKLLDFVLSGGRVFCIESYPYKTPGWKNSEDEERQLHELVDRLKLHPDRFILVRKPENNPTPWFNALQQQYQISPYVMIQSPNPSVTQVRYQAKDTEILVLINSNVNESFNVNIRPSHSITFRNYPWLWDPETGGRHRIEMNKGSVDLDLGPADLRLVIFDKNKRGPVYTPVQTPGNSVVELTDRWKLFGKHIDGTSLEKEIERLTDLKDFAGWKNFCGNLVYNTTFHVGEKNRFRWLNLGKAYGVSEVWLNGVNAGTKWYGRRIYDIETLMKIGNNTLEVRMTTTMGNYLKSLVDNPIAQFWTNEGRTIQPLQSIGLAGPVTIY